ncbi:MAG: putative acetoacetate decarboxylase [Pseudomonadota bacterium]|jgi:acetoacetate decarboxylase
MKIEDIRKNAFAMPYLSPAYSKGPFEFFGREFLIISYRTDPELFRAAVPEPLGVKDPIVNFEFIRMPDSAGFGDYTESGQILAVVDQDGKAAGYSNYLYLDDEAPTAGGREIWGFPKKLAKPRLAIEGDALVGTLNYGSIRVANGTMGYKYTPMDAEAEAKKMMATPNYLLKIIPNPDCTPAICQLTRYYAENVTIKQAWTGPAALELFKHALAPVANLPVLEVVGAKHLVCESYTIGAGEIVFDYLKS